MKSFTRRRLDHLVTWSWRHGATHHWKRWIIESFAVVTPHYPGTRLKALGSSFVARVRHRESRGAEEELKGRLFVRHLPLTRARVRGRWSPNPIVTHVRARTDPIRRVYTMLFFHLPPTHVPSRSVNREEDFARIYRDESQWGVWAAHVTFVPLFAQLLSC